MYPHKGAFPTMGGVPPNLVAPNIPIVGETQWMSQSAYQNIDLEQVDWAQLAQQWIHMKESCGVSPDEPQIQIEAPPPPRFSQPIPEYEEKGEAPMEVEHDDEPPSPANVTAIIAPPAPTNIFQASNWNSESNSRGHQQKPWNRKGNRWNATNSNHSKSQRNASDTFTSGQGYNSNNAKQTTQTPIWTTGSMSAMVSNVPPFVNSNSNHPSDLRMQGLDENHKTGIQLEQVGNLTATPSLDAAQRKTLPAWIREGLEKMEREKQRQAERDREMKERDEKRRQDKLIEQNVLMQLNANESSPKLPAKSKFESDSDSDNDDTVNSDYSENMSMARVAERATVGSSSATANASASSPVSTAVPTFKPHQTKAEILTEIMLSVRKNLTEILLEVTNEEIYAIAQDTLSKVRTKGRKAQSVQKNALTAITPALGLVGYYDSDASKSDDESDSDDEQQDTEQCSSGIDSDSELMKTIQRRKSAFENKSVEIETYLAESEEKEKHWLEQDDGVKTEDTDSLDADSPVPPSSNPSKSLENDEIQRDTHKVPAAPKTERKGSRFSDAKTLVYNVANSQLVNAVQPPPNVRQSSLEHRPSATESKTLKRSRRDEHSDDSDSSRRRSKYSSVGSRSSHHRSRHDSPSTRRHKISSHRRSSSSSSDHSSYSRHSDRSRKHSRRERSSSRSSQGSHKHDKHSHDRSYSRSHSYKHSRR